MTRSTANTSTFVHAKSTSSSKRAVSPTPAPINGGQPLAPSDKNAFVNYMGDGSDLVAVGPGPELDLLDTKKLNPIRPGPTLPDNLPK
ncbi:hypothetical protein NCS52_00210100 [Fusarium sp. LHS14.1]|nr:hypothetical protein NCS52_00210100 [Fusarium sp. LHS14.1]